MITFDPKDVWEEGKECKVWLGDDGYVYKLYNKLISAEILKRRLELLNSLPEYETEELYKITQDGCITKLKKLKDWQLIFALFYISHNRREKDWKPVLKQYMISKGYEKYREGWRKGDIFICDIEISNIGMTDEDEIKIIDAHVMSINGMRNS